MKEVIQITVTVLLVLGLVLGALYGMIVMTDRYKIAECSRMSEMTGYPTVFQSGYCWVEVRQNLWLKFSELPYYLPLIDASRQP